MFNLNDELSDLAFTGLDRYGIPDGTVPEPREEVVRNWDRRQKELQLALDIDIPPGASGADIARIILSRKGADLVSDLQADNYAELCGGVRPRRPRPLAPADLELPPPPDAGDTAAAASYAALCDEARAEHREKLDAHRADLRGWYSEWEGGTPTRLQLADLPFRPARLFYGWLTGMVINPEPSPAATTD